LCEQAADGVDCRHRVRTGLVAAVEHFGCIRQVYGTARHDSRWSIRPLFGGAAAALFCREDPRCKAAIDVDGAPHGTVIQAGIGRPFMFLLSDHSHESGPETLQIKANIQSIYDRLPADGRLHVEIRGANHFLFSDGGALLKSHIVLRTLRALGVIGIDGRRQLAVTAYCLHSFFDAYLRGTGVSRLNISSPLYPELQVLE
jgi:hypothetical protein